MSTSIDDLLGEIVVDFPDDRDDAVESGNLHWPEGWYAVSDNNGIRAYFQRENDAFAFRLMVINMRFNALGVIDHDDDLRIALKEAEDNRDDLKAELEVTRMELRAIRGRL